MALGLTFPGQGSQMIFTLDYWKQLFKVVTNAVSNGNLGNISNL